MKRLLGTIILLLILGNTINAVTDGISFNENWRFFKGEIKGAEAISFDDDSWRKLNLPHDWAIEGPFDSKYNARCGGLPFHGTGWYRKTFIGDAQWKDKIVRIGFDGAMSEAKVWINGVKVGEHPYGYTGFEIDITKYLKIGEENVLAVQLTPRDLSSRWYPGAGIYRNVWLRVDNKVYIPEHGVYVTTPTVTKSKAVVQIETTVKNATFGNGKFNIRHSIINAQGETVAILNDNVEVAAGEQGKTLAYINMLNPNIWGQKNPYMYKLKTEIYDGKDLTDTYFTDFGIRKICFTKDGFFLNGEKIRFNGVCLHHDNGPMGAAVNVRADERKLQIMKEMGVNAIRTSHNPPSPEFLDLCDRMGLVVLDEAFDEWTKAKVDNGYHLYFDEWSKKDLTSLIMRDRNHPSVIMWSIGNEILEQSDKKKGFTVAKYLADICRELDPTRPSTCGFNYYPAPFDNNMAQQVDIAGMNYKPGKYAEVQRLYPDLPLYGSETSSCTSSRGVYHLPIEKYEKNGTNQVTSYDLIGPKWAYPPDIEFHFQEMNPRFLGEFIWTGFDYLGEPTPYGGRDNSTHGYWNDDWPSRSSYFGAVDLCGLPKDRFYLYQSQWTDKPMVHILPHWNWKKGMNIPVYVYTNCYEAELFLNGKSLGKRVKGRDLTEIMVSFNHYAPNTFQSKYRLSWDVPFEPGELTVKAYNNLGELKAEKTIRTAGKPAQIKLIPDRKVITADGKDLSYITVRIEDRDGNLCPEADNLVEFSVEGAGHFRAVGNGNAATTESFIEPKRKAFSGMCMLIVQSDENKQGKMNITATSKGLKTAKTTINVEL